MCAHFFAVVWTSAVESLQEALKFFDSSAVAREFAERYMTAIINILVDQQHAKIGVNEKNCVQDSIILAVRIVAKDLAVQVKKNGQSKMLPTLQLAFDKTKAFYRGTKNSWSMNHHSHSMGGAPQVRLRAVDEFRKAMGFDNMLKYLQQRVQEHAHFPELVWIHDMLEVLFDLFVDAKQGDGALFENDAISLSHIVMEFIQNCSEDDLKRINTEDLKTNQSHLQLIFDRLSSTRRSEMLQFYQFWRVLILKLISSKSLPLKLFGWEQMSDIIYACEAHRPPPRSFTVSNAGTTFVNGEYVFAGEETVDGYAKLGTDTKYVYEIPKDALDGGGKTLTLFRCTMRSQQKWWFLSEADEEQPGTDRDIDYYQHKSKFHQDEAFPPREGWTPCKTSVAEPSPILSPKESMVPSGEEFQTLEHALAQWAIENKIVEQVLGDTTIHREVVSRSTGLIRFLAQMCSRVDIESPSGSQYCLQSSHLQFAWKTCTRKADAAVSLQVYQLLVSILPLCPAALSVPLLQAIQASLHESDENRDYLNEVSEFCSALADGIIADVQAMSRHELQDDVRTEVLNLLWAVLIHPEASALKSYEKLRHYVSVELRVEPKGSDHRERFVRSCVSVLDESKTCISSSTDEVKSLRMMKLLDFVLCTCPLQHAQQIVQAEENALARMVLEELLAYLKRRKVCSVADVLAEPRHTEALFFRLTVLRHVFSMSLDSIPVAAMKELWSLCVSTNDRESFMIFVASASNMDRPSDYETENVPANPTASHATALSEEVCHFLFIDLLCANDISFEALSQRAYCSFQFMFEKHRLSTEPSADKTRGLDALWRIILTAGMDIVADQAMKDLLRVYVVQHVPDMSTEMVTSDANDFPRRIEECLANATTGMKSNASNAERSAQRLLRLLKAALGSNSLDPLAVVPSVNRLSALSFDASLEQALQCLPHGLRGQVSNIRIGVLAKDTRQRPAATLRHQLTVHPLESLESLKEKVAIACQCAVSSVKPIQVNGRSQTRRSSHVNLGEVPENAVTDELGVVQGCEIVFVLTDTLSQRRAGLRESPLEDLSMLVYDSKSEFASRLFAALLRMLEVLPVAKSQAGYAAHSLVWELLLAMPSDKPTLTRIDSFVKRSEDEMDVDDSTLLPQTYDHAVYVLMAVDSLFQPAPEALSVATPAWRQLNIKCLLTDAHEFRQEFIRAGGLTAVVNFFSADKTEFQGTEKCRRGNAVALRVLKTCLFDGENEASTEVGSQLLSSLADVDGLVRTLIAMVVEDSGVSPSTVADILLFLSLLFRSPDIASRFGSLKDAERFLISLLMWDGGSTASRSSSFLSSASQVRKSTQRLILSKGPLADFAFPWLMRAVGAIDSTLESTDEFFDVLEKLISGEGSQRERFASETGLRDVGLAVCKKLALYPKPSSNSSTQDHATSVLRGCLRTLSAIIKKSGGRFLREATNGLLSDLQINHKWSQKDENRGVLSMVASSFVPRTPDDDTLVDLMGAIFEGFLTPNGATGESVCSDSESRRCGFDVVQVAASECGSSNGYCAIVARMEKLMASIVPKLRNKWGQLGQIETQSHRKTNTTYSGLRNQGCTCYMNSVLQQLFMMPDLRDSLCSAPLPSALRGPGRSKQTSGIDLVGKKISLQWESGVSYDASVESYNETTGMHTIRYHPVYIATAVSGPNSPRGQQRLDNTKLPPNMRDEFILSDGRPGKETGVYDVVNDGVESQMETDATSSSEIEETEDEAASRRLLEDVQRTFIHLNEGTKGRCFDPRSLVEACACLKLEFDVWQQNDASEFATKLLDRLEISLKKWAPDHFQHMDHTFGLKQTKQKICKECGLKSNREEKLLNIDCQIRGKSDIHEALEAMTEVEIMEGSNKVYCDSCKKNTDTVLRTALSTLPNVLILSLKRFDLDFTTFETVKLNSRCAFGQTLNLKKYTLSAMEEPDATEDNATTPMDTESEEKEKPLPSAQVDDDDYEYRLVGVLVHAGVAQGGHYYSFIKDRGEEELSDKWHRFDDDDVTPFDPSMIEAECFGGSVKKETKFPNGQVRFDEQERIANALMLFYEKVKPTPLDLPKTEPKIPSEVATSSGYDAFEPDVRKLNATHRSQSFLFDTELQRFLKNLLSTFRLKRKAQADDAFPEWLIPLTDLVISYFFDILLYSADLSFLDEWVEKLVDILQSEKRVCVPFVRKLAAKTDCVSSNWLRTFLFECPNQRVRLAAVTIFSSAVTTHVLCGEERMQLAEWTRAWIEHEKQLRDERSLPYPPRLTGQGSELENIALIQSGRASSVGIVLSFVNQLLDATPRAWRYTSETVHFIRNLAKATLDVSKRPLQRPLIACCIPARLIGLCLRERSPPILRTAFPGVSMSLELANAQSRPESGPGQMLPVSSGGMMSTSDMSNHRGPRIRDINTIVEALLCIGGIPQAVHEPVFKDPDDMGRRNVFTDKTTAVLETIFQENVTPQSPRLNRYEVEVYLRGCRNDPMTTSPQKVHEIMNKYGVPGPISPDKYLDFDGFICFYRELATLDEPQFRSDINVQGFRPDFSRRSRDVRLFHGEVDAGKPRSSPESVGIDVSDLLKEKPFDLGFHGNMALTTPHLHITANDASEILMQYLTAASVIGKDSKHFITRCLQMIYVAPHDWNGNQRAVMLESILNTVVSVTGEFQERNIALVMQCSEAPTRNASGGCGLLEVIKNLQNHMRPTHYTSEIFNHLQRYMNIIRSLYTIDVVHRWLDKNRNLWTFSERDLTEVTHQAAMPSYPSHSIPMDAHQSDSDGGGMTYSDEDEDSPSEAGDVDRHSLSHPPTMIRDAPGALCVEHAGNPTVNGIYQQSGLFGGACRYIRRGYWKEKEFQFFIFQCPVSNNTKHWYISIVPFGGNPGTSSDIDFYTAPVTHECQSVPPVLGWTKAAEGLDPPPSVQPRTLPDEIEAHDDHISEI